MEYISNKASCACVLTALISSTFTFNTHAASISDLLITEVMANPSQVSDANGEWFELFNPTSTSINLQGYTLSDDRTTGHTISVDNALYINPGQFFVMAKNGDSLINGGFDADYVYSSFTLGNSGDQIVFSSELIELLRLDYSASFDVAGHTMALLGHPMTEASYALTDVRFNYGLGDIGTPGTAGDYAPTAVPIPAAGWLFFSGLLGMFGISRRHKNKN